MLPTIVLQNIRFVSVKSLRYYSVRLPLVMFFSKCAISFHFKTALKFHALGIYFRLPCLQTHSTRRCFKVWKHCNTKVLQCVIVNSQCCFQNMQPVFILWRFPTYHDFSFPFAVSSITNRVSQKKLKIQIRKNAKKKVNRTNCFLKETVFF